MKKEQRDKRKNEKEDYRERNSMVAVNIQALVECTCYLIFGILLFYLTYSGKYLKYVTPRMKPYLYGLSVLMFICTYWHFLSFFHVFLTLSVFFPVVFVFLVTHMLSPGFFINILF